MNKDLLCRILETSLIFIIIWHVSAPILDVKANFVLNIPISPDSNPLIIQNKSPNYQKYNKKEVTLNFTITKPQSWFQYGSHSIGYVLWIEYSLDGEEYQEIPINDTISNNPPVTLEFSVPLKNLTEGAHTLQIKACGRSYYGGSPPNYNDIERFLNMVFKVEAPTTSPTPELELLQNSFPLGIATLVITMLLCFGLFAVLVKRRSKPK